MSLNYNCWMDQHKDLYEEKTGRRSAARRERKKESTRKRRVACPFHLVYQATYRYNAAPTRVISLSLYFSNGSIPIFFLFQVTSATKIIVLSFSLSTSFVSLYWLCHAVSEWTIKSFWNLLPYIKFACRLVNIPFSSITWHPSEIKGENQYPTVSGLFSSSILPFAILNIPATVSRIHLNSTEFRLGTNTKKGKTLWAICVYEEKQVRRSNQIT